MKTIVIPIIFPIMKKIILLNEKIPSKNIRITIGKNKQIEDK